MPIPYEYFFPIAGMCWLGIILFYQLHAQTKIKLNDGVIATSIILGICMGAIVILPTIHSDPRLGEIVYYARIDNAQLFAKMVGWTVLIVILSIIPYDSITAKMEWENLYHVPISPIIIIALLIVQFRMVLGGFSKIIELFL